MPMLFPPPRFKPRFKVVASMVAPVLGAALSLAALCAPSLAQVNTLSDEVTHLVSNKKLGAARVGVSLIDMETGAALANVHAADPFTPASNMKLLTSGAALLVLGPDFAFKTELVRDGERLIVRAGGDPALADPVILQTMEPKLNVNDILAALAGAVTNAGMKDVHEIIIDDRVFDREYVHPTWPTEHLDRGYCAEVCGLNFHANVLYFYPRPNPQGAGTPPLFAIEPEAPWMRVDIRARTVMDGKNSAWVTREAGENHFAIRGDVHIPTQAPIEVTCHNPAELFGRLLADQLTKAGVHVTQVAQDEPAVRLAGDQEVLAAGKTLAVVRTPITEVLHRCNSDSENLYAESLMKRMGNAITKEPGSWGNGSAVLRMMLTEKLGADFAAATTINDGSGLSRGNLVAPATLTRWLIALASDPKSKDAFTESLATPGNGTLKKRFIGAKLANQVRGKSGFINGVRCLSGYVISPSGRRVAFSVMVNDISSDDQTREALELHEEIVKLADKWLAQQGSLEKVGG